MCPPAPGRFVNLQTLIGFKLHQHLSNPCITSPTPPTLPHPGPPFPWLCSCYNESLEFMEALEDKLAPHLKGGLCSKGGGVGAASTRCSSARQRSPRPPAAQLPGTPRVHPLPRPCKWPAEGHPPPTPSLPPARAAGQQDIEAACRGFLELAREAASACVALIYSDPGFADLFPRLYCSEEWRSGGAPASIVATLEDFLADYQRLVEPGFYRRCARRSDWPGRGGGLGCACVWKGGLRGRASSNLRDNAQPPRPRPLPHALRCRPAAGTGIACATVTAPLNPPNPNPQPRPAPAGSWRAVWTNAWRTFWRRC